MSEPKRRRKTSDLAILGGPTADGEGARVLRIKDGSLSAGELRPVKEGEAITHKEVVRLRPLDEEHRICEVEVMHQPPAPQSTPETDAPKRRARVSTASYRKNWSTIFEPVKRPGKDWSVN